jgi:hypothetical protein
VNTSVKAIEGKRNGSRGPEYGAVISAVIDAAHPIDQEIRHVNESLINWLASRRHTARSLTFTYTAPAEKLDEIMSWTKRLLEQDFQWKSHVEGLERVELKLIDHRTGTTRHFVLKAPS